MSLDAEELDHKNRASGMSRDLEWYGYNFDYRITPCNQLIIFIDNVLYAVVGKSYDEKTESWLTMWTPCSISVKSILKKEYSPRAKLEFNCLYPQLLFGRDVITGARV